MLASTSKRRLSGGVEVQGPDTVHVRVWAPACRRVDFVIRDGASHALKPAEDGHFEGTISGVEPGTHSGLRLDGDRLRPDPVSRCQPEGPGGPSAVVDSLTFHWTDDGWPGVEPRGQVLYEMHV